MQEAKWEADFLAKMQDTDGGFYFLVYPQNREYENNVTPDHGDPQVVWPKTTSVTRRRGRRPGPMRFLAVVQATYPAAAALYLQKAQLGWKFLTNAVAKYGKNGAYQKITNYGDDFADQDELAWAACEMYLATGDPAIQQTPALLVPDPSDPPPCAGVGGDCIGMLRQRHPQLRLRRPQRPARLPASSTPHSLPNARQEIAAAGR